MNQRYDTLPRRRPTINRLRYATALTLLADVPLVDCRVLDVGCGAGEFAGLLADRGARPIGLDLSLANLRELRARDFSAAVADMNRPLPVASETIDLAVSLEVIEHIPAAEAYVAEIARVLKPGGWLVLSTPNVGYWVFRARALVGAPPHQEGYHYRFFTKASLDALLAEHGLQIVRRRAVIYAFVWNRVRKIMGRTPVWLRLPSPLEPLLARNFHLLARKPR